MTSPKYTLSQYLQRGANALAAQQNTDAAKAQEICRKAKKILNDFPEKDYASQKLRVVGGLLAYGVLSSAFASRHLRIHDVFETYKGLTCSLKAIGDALIEEGVPIHLFQEKGKEYCLAMDGIDQAECTTVLAQFRELCK